MSSLICGMSRKLAFAQVLPFGVSVGRWRRWTHHLASLRITLVSPPRALGFRNGAAVMTEGRRAGSVVSPCDMTLQVGRVVRSGAASSRSAAFTPGRFVLSGGATLVRLP